MTDQVDKPRERVDPIADGYAVPNKRPESDKASRKHDSQNKLKNHLRLFKKRLMGNHRKVIKVTMTRATTPTTTIRAPAPSPGPRYAKIITSLQPIGSNNNAATTNQQDPAAQISMPYYRRSLYVTFLLFGNKTRRVVPYRHDQPLSMRQPHGIICPLEV